MTHSEPHELTEEQGRAIFGASLALAASDGIHDKELRLLFEGFDIAGMGAEHREHVHRMLVEPPEMLVALRPLVDSPMPVRHGALITLARIAVIDGGISEPERLALNQAAQELGVSDEQLKQIEKLASTFRDIEDGTIKPSMAEEALKGAMAGMSGVGVPVAAVAISGSVFGLSAAGITSGLAALGLGLGMMTGIGTVVVMGVAVFAATRWALGAMRRALTNKLPPPDPKVPLARAVANYESAQSWLKKWVRQQKSRALDDPAAEQQLEHALALDALVRRGLHSAREDLRRL